MTWGLKLRKEKKYFDKLKGGRSTTTWRTSTEQMLTSWTCPARFAVVAFILLFYRQQHNKIAKLPSELSDVFLSFVKSFQSGNILPRWPHSTFNCSKAMAQTVVGFTKYGRQVSKCKNQAQKPNLWHHKTWKHLIPSSRFGHLASMRISKLTKQIFWSQ